jgi:hypothetical protein
MLENVHYYSVFMKHQVCHQSIFKDKNKGHAADEHVLPYVKCTEFRDAKA